MIISIKTLVVPAKGEEVLLEFAYDYYEDVVDILLDNKKMCGVDTENIENFCRGFLEIIKLDLSNDEKE